LAELRVGTAVDAHRLVPGRPLVLGGVHVPHPFGLDGHSDADIVCHALLDASLGAAGAGDIGRRFPGTPEFRDAVSLDLLARTYGDLTAEGWRLVNADCVVVLQAPRLAPHVEEMAQRLAAAMRTTPDRVSVRGTTSDGLGFTGRGEGAAAQAVVLLEREAGRGG
jgi:2-C-methyl-D-erythritol 2,4-cyclodiphosphate synthase